MRSINLSRLVRCCRLVVGAAALSAALQAQACEYAVAVETQSYRPYFSVESGRYEGYARELLDAFAATLGCRFSYRPLPIKRAHGGFLAGQLDFRFPDNPTWNAELKQEHSVHYSAPVIDFVDGLLVLPQHVGRGQGAIRELGTLLGFTPASYAAAIATGEITLRQVRSTRSLLQMGLMGRVDAVYLNPVVARLVLAEMGRPQALHFDPGLPFQSDHYYLSSLRHPQLLQRFNAFLRDSGELQRALRHKYDL